MIKNDNQNYSTVASGGVPQVGLTHQSSIKFARGRKQLHPLHLELPDKSESALNLSASAASTRRSSAMCNYGSDVSQLSSAGSDKQDPSPKVSAASAGKSVLANYSGSGSGQSNMLIVEDDMSRNQNQLPKKAATNEILDRTFFMQLRKERELRQQRDEEIEVVKRNSMIFDRDVTLKGRVTQRRATKSIDNMGSAIQSSQDTIDLFRNWQNNFNSLCDKKLTKLNAQQAIARKAAVTKVKPAIVTSPRALPLPKITKSPVQPKQLRPCEFRRPAGASQALPRRNSQQQQMIRGIPYRSILPGIAKPTAN